MGEFPICGSSSACAPRHDDDRHPWFHRMLIHVRYPKTGSSWVQEDLFPRPAAGFWPPWRLEAKEQLLRSNPYRFSAERVRGVFKLWM